MEPAQLHMDAAEEAKRVLMELMVSSEVNPDCLLSPLGFNAPWQQGREEGLESLEVLLVVRFC